MPFALYPSHSEVVHSKFRGLSLGDFEAFMSFNGVEAYKPQPKEALDIKLDEGISRL